MQVHFGLGLLRAEWRESVVCIGTFDGVHVGHQTVIRQAVAEARAQELPCVLLTFDVHPHAVLAPEKCPKTLVALQQKLRALEGLGVSAAVVLRFDAELSQISADRFLDEILRDALRASRLVIGHDFALGHRRQGDGAWLSARIPTTVVPRLEIDGVRVSSSLIRQAVADGRMEYASELLGRPFALSGVVVGGQKLGRTIGYPTANIARSFNQSIPMEGVYAGWLSCDRGRFMAATSIGVRPVVGGGNQTVEAYLLDYSGESLYGLPVELELHHRLREERNYPSLEELKHQIEIDVEETRRILLS